METDTGSSLVGPRSARPEERTAILDTLNWVHRVTHGKAPSIATDWAHVYARENIGNVLVIEDGDRVICAVGIWTNDVALGKVIVRVGGINCLASLPEYRQHGLGSQIMRAAQHHMIEMGCQVALLGTQITNWYRKLGWELAGCARSYRFDRSNIRLLPSLPRDLETETLQEGRLTEVVRLRNQDQLGGIRQQASFRTILAARGGARVLLAGQKNRASAYLLARDRSIIEWGGPAELVAGLVRAWFEQTDSPSARTSVRDESRRPILNDKMTLVSPASGHPFVVMLDHLRIPHTRDYVGMMYLLNPKRLLRASGHEDIAVLEQDAGFRLVRGKEQVDLTRCELTKLFLGPEHISDFANDVFPFPFWQWPLEHV